MLLRLVFECMRQSQRTAGDRASWTPGRKRAAPVSWRQMLVYLQLIVFILKHFGFSPHPVIVLLIAMVNMGGTLRACVCWMCDIYMGTGLTAV